MATPGVDAGPFVEVHLRPIRPWAALCGGLPVIAQAISAFPANSIVLDGEIVAIDRKGMFPDIGCARARRSGIYRLHDLLR